MADPIPSITAEELETARADGLLGLIQRVLDYSQTLDLRNKELQARLAQNSQNSFAGPTSAAISKVSFRGG
jgi:hypothetical protein